MDKLGIDESRIQNEIPYKEVGKVPKGTKEAIINAIEEVFTRTGFHGQPPEMVSVAEGACILPSGEEVPGVYNFDVENRQKPGKIFISAKLSETALWSGWRPLSVQISTAAVAAHEAMEHVNFMLGKELLYSGSKLSLRARANSPTDKEANKIAREVIKDLHGVTVYFVDETPPISYFLSNA